MEIPKTLIGVDMSADSFTFTPYDSLSKEYGEAQLVENNLEGLTKLQAYLEEHSMTSSNTVYII